MFDNEFIKYASNEELEFILFDDGVSLEATEFGNNSDWIGTAQFSLKIIIFNLNLKVFLYNLYSKILISISWRMFSTSKK